MISLEPDQDSGGSDSDCSLEFVNDTAENNTKTENPDKYIKIKKKSAELLTIFTPQPIVMNKKKYKENTVERTNIMKYISSISSPKSFSPKKVDVLQSETSITPQVFIFLMKNWDLRIIRLAKTKNLSISKNQSTSKNALI